MAMITKQEVLKLVNEQSSNYVSIYIPTHRAGAETLDGQDKIRLKTQLKNAKAKLEQRGLSDKEVEELVKPVNELINDNEFWRHQSDGLAIFLSENTFKKYTVPVNFEEFNYVADEFYLKPLMPLFNGDGLFYLLSLKNDEVKFYEGTRYTMTEVITPEEVPSRLEDVVGYDFEQKNLQFRSGQQGDSKSGMYHGAGEGKAEELNEMKRYFRAVNDGIMTMLHDDQNPPLVVSCQDFQFPVYKDVNTYQNLYDEHVSGNPEDKDINQLHEEAWSLLQPHFTKTRKEKLNLYSEYIGTGKASADINMIVKSAIEGRIDSLFVQSGAEIFGDYDHASQEANIQDKLTDNNISLLNLIAIKVFEKGGSIYIMEKEAMPDENHKKVNALYRY
ncbi:hypothetical protein LB450_07400 [Psychroflexus sp. CAK1W]|uniref:baeRF7 domain-containing protein n=1 Tax=Psychroflexus curvus TaxID=2873595 RepID=UPI001CCC6D8D|nr:hypothetical protein [Psychroflexus curvus]MBZ9627922.1 hypothetical protein [Psychroflexus curvus]